MCACIPNHSSTILCHHCSALPQFSLSWQQVSQFHESSNFELHRHVPRSPLMTSPTKKRKRPPSLTSQQQLRTTGDGHSADAAAAQDHLLLFKGITAYFVETGIQPRRLQIWKQKLQQLGAVLEERWSKHLSHVFAASVEALTEQLGSSKLGKRKQKLLNCSWIEDSLKAGMCLPTNSYVLELSSGNKISSRNASEDADLRGFSQEDLEASQSQSKTSDWMQIIKEGGKIGVVSGNRKKEGWPLDSQGESMEEGNSMEDSELAEAGYTPPNLNSHITGPFSEMRDLYNDALGDDRRAFSYTKALSVLEKVPFRITSVDEVKGLPTIGKSLIDSIQEILSSGKLSKLEHLRKDEKVQVISLFGSVWGIGPTTAQKLYSKGHRSLEDLKHDSTLSPPQRLGLMFHDDIIKKIPRHEMAVMDSIVQKSGAELRSGISIVCGGSYRRGKAMSGDIDFIMTHPDGHSHRGFLQQLVRKLHAEDFLTEDLRLSLEHSIEGTEHGVDTYFGLCKFPGRLQRHRIDLKVYPFDQYPFGLIQWTGNNILNRRLRILAEKQGYRLDDHGLFPVIADGYGGKVKSPVSVPCKSEREVFEKLDFPWLEPNQRNL